MLKLFHQLAQTYKRMHKNYFFFFFYDLSYFSNYFNTVKLMTAGDQQTVRRINIIKVLFLLQAVHFTGFFLLQDALSPLTNLLAVNFFYLDEVSQNENIWIVLFCLFGFAHQDIAYCQNNGLTADIVRRIIVDGSGEGWFLSQPKAAAAATAEGWFSETANKEVPKKKRAKKWGIKKRLNSGNLVEKFQLYALLLINLCKLSCVFCSTFAGALFLKNLLIFAQNGLFGSVWGLTLVFFVFTPNYLLLVRTSYHLFDVIVLSGVTGFIANWIVYTRLEQVNNRSVQAGAETTNNNVRTFTPKKLSNFLQLNVQYLTVLADLDRVHGAALFDFLLLSYPSNATIVTIIVKHSKTDLLLNIILGFVALFQLTFMLVCHLCVTRMTATAHRPVGPMIRVNLGLMPFSSSSCSKSGRQNRFDLKAKLKLSHYIAAFHTDQKYGLNYRQFGPITFATYQKVTVKFLELFYCFMKH